MTNESLGQKIINKAKELNPSYTPDKFNDVGEALDIVLSNCKKPEEVLDINIELNLTTAQFTQGAAWLEDVGTVTEGNKVWNSRDSQGMPKKARVHAKLILDDSELADLVLFMTPYYSVRSCGYYGIFTGAVNQQVILTLSFNVYTNGLDDTLASHIVIGSHSIV